MSKRLVIVAYYGPWPDWIDPYLERAQGRGFDWLIHSDLGDLARRVHSNFGVGLPGFGPGNVFTGGTKIHDYRPFFGRLFEPELVGYDWWAHTDVDCVYGRLDRFWDDDRVDGYDVVTDHDSYLCGPWTMYRNLPEINDAFAAGPEDFKEMLTSADTTGWVERSFTTAINDVCGGRVLYDQRHAYGDPAPLHAAADGGLFYGAREIPMFHFRRTKQWPLAR